jgi:hypothetical protein
LYSSSEIPSLRIVSVTAWAGVSSSRYCLATALPASDSTGFSIACRPASLSDWSGVCGEIATGVAPASRMFASAP